MLAQFSDLLELPLAGHEVTQQSGEEYQEVTRFSRKSHGRNSEGKRPRNIDLPAPAVLAGFPGLDPGLTRA